MAAFDKHAAAVAYRVGRSYHRAPEARTEEKKKMFTPNRLIGLSGAAGAGKTTAADVFIENNWTTVAFAEPLKRMLHELLLARGVGRHDVWRYTDGDLKEQPTEYLMNNSPRHAMQTLGTEWGRENISQALWIDTARRRIKALGEIGDAVVVTDVRFPNEVNLIRELGGVVYRVIREGVVPVRAHGSELSLNTMQLPLLKNDYATAAEFKKYVDQRFF